MVLFRYISAEILQIKLERKGNMTSKDSLSSVVWEEGVYHEQKNPAEVGRLGHEILGRSTVRCFLIP